MDDIMDKLSEFTKKYRHEFDSILVAIKEVGEKVENDKDFNDRVFFLGLGRVAGIIMQGYFVGMKDGDQFNIVFYFYKGLLWPFFQSKEFSNSKIFDLFFYTMSLFYANSNRLLGGVDKIAAFGRKLGLIIYDLCREYKNDENADITDIITEMLMVIPNLSMQKLSIDDMPDEVKEIFEQQFSGKSKLVN